MDIAIWIVVCLFASVGIVQAVGWMICLLMKPKRQGAGYFVLSLPEDPAALESQLRYTLTTRRWNGGMQDVLILLLENGLSEESMAICEKMLQGVPGIFVCTPQNLAATIEKFDNLQTEEQTV